MSAAAASALSLQGLLMPRLTSSPLNVSYAHLRMQPPAFASSRLFSCLLPSSVARQRRHLGQAPVWGQRRGWAGTAGMWQRLGSVPGHCTGTQGGALCSGDRQVWDLMGSAGVWGLRAGARGILGSCGGVGGVPC